MPSYTVVDASVRWDVGDALGLTLKVDNLFDELYASGTYSGSWIVGKRKTAALALDHRF